MTTTEATTEATSVDTDVQPYLTKLASFDTAEDIHRFLVDEGVRGYRRVPRGCALAEYVHISSGHEVCVGRRHTFSVSSEDTTHMVHSLGSHTDAMADFVDHFDAGDYPDLEIT